MKKREHIRKLFDEFKDHKAIAWALWGLAVALVAMLVGHIFTQCHRDQSITTTRFPSTIATGKIHPPSQPPTLSFTHPGAPAGIRAVRGNEEATVYFDAPTSDGGSRITVYTVTSNPGWITKKGSASPIIVTGLSNGTAYSFTVTATNEVGTGPVSGPSNSVTPATEPGAPTNVTVVAGNAQATVYFDAPTSDGGSRITVYTVTSNPGGITKKGSASPIMITELSNGIAYTFRVAATNDVGPGPASSPSRAVTPVKKPTKGTDQTRKTSREPRGEEPPSAPLRMTLSAFQENTGLLEISNTSDRDVTITLVDPITLHTPQNKIQMTHDGTLTGNWGIFTDRYAECTSGNLELNNRTHIQPGEIRRVPLRPRESKQHVEVKSGAFLQIPLCYRSGNSGPGNIWKAQIPIGNK